MALIGLAGDITTIFEEVFLAINFSLQFYRHISLGRLGSLPSTNGTSSSSVSVKSY